MIIALQIRSSDSITSLMITHFNKCLSSVYVLRKCFTVVVFFTKSGHYCWNLLLSIAPRTFLPTWWINKHCIYLVSVMIISRSVSVGLLEFHSICCLYICMQCVIMVWHLGNSPVVIALASDKSLFKLFP